MKFLVTLIRVFSALVVLFAILDAVCQPPPDSILSNAYLIAAFAFAVLSIPAIIAIIREREGQ